MKVVERNASGRRLFVGMAAWVLAGACVAAGSAARGAMITFSAPVTVTDTSALDVPPNAGGTFLEGANIGGSSETITTTGGHSITLAASPTQFGDVNMPAAAGTTSGFYNGKTQSSTLLFPGTTGSSAFDAVLRSNTWHDNVSDATRPLTLRVAGLTIGQTYDVSLFSADARTTDRTQAYYSSFSGGTFSGGSSTSFSQNPATMVIGTFVADAAYQDIFVHATDTVGNADTTIAAYTVYAMPAPEPASLGVLAAGGLLLMRRRRAS